MTADNNLNAKNNGQKYTKIKRAPMWVGLGKYGFGYGYGTPEIFNWLFAGKFGMNKEGCSRIVLQSRDLRMMGLALRMS
ncbi:MAG: hypothetical protein EBZ78_11325 [Verrucomicrobia bacterium]|nr:hypothetical protein [Verrucomicrobiota bacterium]